MENVYKTKNLFIASYILSSGKATFRGLETITPKTKLFLFSPYDLAQQLESDYLSGGELPVKRVFSEYNVLKDLLFNQSSSEKNYEILRGGQR